VWFELLNTLHENDVAKCYDMKVTCFETEAKFFKQIFSDFLIAVFVSSFNLLCMSPCLYYVRLSI